MDQLESQVAKIQIDSGKNAASYVYVLAEKAPASSAELYAVIELPLFNPAAADACEAISLAIAGAFKRAYKKNLGANIFETAVAQINEELSKLVENGNTNWVNKINCILAVKDDNNFSIATCGKIAAYLYRAREFTDISCSSDKPSPLKTFENLAFGKLRLEDVIILSTTQLFNYLSIDRLKNLLEKGNFLAGVREILETLKQNAGPEVAFGAILNLQVLPGQTQNEEIDLEGYAGAGATAASPLSKVLLRLKLPKFSLPKFSFSWDRLKKMFGQSKNVVSTAGSLIKRQTHNLTAEKIKNYSRTKKIFFVSIIILVCAFILDVSIAAHHKKIAQSQSRLAGQLQAVQTLLAQAQSSLLYKDTATAQTDVLQAQSQMPKSSDVSKNDEALFSQVTNQLNTLKQSLENSVTPQIINLGSLGAGTTLLSLGNYLATQINGTILSYNLTNGAVEDSALLSSQKILAAAYINNTLAVVYNGSALLSWDYGAKQFSQPFTPSVPNEASFVDLKYYSTNSRVYTIDKGSNQIISFAVSQNGLSKPIVGSKPGDDFSNALDFAIDGNIYVLTATGIDEYRSGNPVNFTMPTLFTPFSGKGKIYTEIGWANLYVLDSGNNRILVIDKQGNLVETLQSPQFTNLKDFVVDEPGKVIYVLNDSSLLKVSLP
jgi:hypothetical protein